eukprot:TRINITY_DN8429_c0_g1_i1.p1 TRINITY_DN8429_c0_g1~~TRINITY_DN8429_c0_g1_i1.p1  ORF type:complete len:132 (+),score=31.58 TRINITY_DN8429_c0_g1_i1:26-397(+)
MLQEVVPSREDVAQASASRQASAVEAERRMLQKWAELAPAAFEPASEEVRSCLAAVGRNFVASQQPLGTPISGDHEGVPAVSAGHESHPSTTHSATEQVFAFLQLGAEGQAENANNELRAALL